MLKLNQEIPVIKQTNARFRAVSIIRDINTNQLMAEISFDILNEEGKVITTLSGTYRGVEFNNFWEHFNSGSFLYEEFAKRNNLDTQIPNLEDEFKNKVE